MAQGNCSICAQKWNIYRYVRGIVDKKTTHIGHLAQLNDAEVILCFILSNCQVVMHVSTAYSNCHLRFIEEKFYNYPFRFDDLSLYIDKLDDKALDNITPK